MEGHQSHILTNESIFSNWGNLLMMNQSNYILSMYVYFLTASYWRSNLLSLHLKMDSSEHDLPTFFFIFFFILSNSPLKYQSTTGYLCFIILFSSIGWNQNSKKSNSLSVWHFRSSSDLVWESDHIMKMKWNGNLFSLI